MRTMIESTFAAGRENIYPFAHSAERLPRSQLQIFQAALLLYASVSREA
jgi:hypothetical protein